MVALVDQIVSLAGQAGADVLDHYEPGVAVQLKEDRSPLTRADLASHACIMSGLADIDPDTPVVSEEGELPSIEERRSWRRFYPMLSVIGSRASLSTTAYCERTSVSLSKRLSEITSRSTCG